MLKPNTDRMFSSREIDVVLVSGHQGKPNISWCGAENSSNYHLTENAYYKYTEIL